MRAAVSLVAVAVLLTGCATVESPHTALQNMNTKAPRYESDECRRARQDAMAYDENIGARVGAGLALGLLLGPFGLPLAIAGDAAQAEKRKATVAQLRDACDGDLVAGPAGAAILQLREELGQLEAQRAQGQITEAEYKSRRDALVSKHLDAQVVGAGRTLAVGTEFVLRDRESISGATLHESRLLVTGLEPEAVEFNGGDLAMWRRTAKVRGGRMPGSALSGFDPTLLKQGDRVKVTFHPANQGDEAVPVELRVEGDETMTADNGAVTVVRARLSGFASYEGPYQTPQAWRGARMEGPVWIDRTSGLVLKAAVDCHYPTYALKRDLVRATLPLRSE